MNHRTILALASAGLGLGLGLDGMARADDTPPPPVAAPANGVTGLGCALKGTYAAPKGAQIYDAASGGKVLASFTGALEPMTLSDIPADPTTGRARLATSLGAGAFRLEGFVAASAVAVFAQRDLAIHSGHVWISEGQRVRLVQGAPGSLTVEVTVAGTNGQTARATAPCDALALQPGAPSAMAVPGNARGYLSKGASVDLFDEPNGTLLFSLKALDGAQQLFWSTESRAGFVHLRARGTLTIDAWAKVASVEALKKGEMMDQFLPPSTSVAGAQLVLDRTPRLVQATRAASFFARRDDKGKPIGVIEAGAEVYVIETMLGWSNVLPKNLGLSPADDGGFWLPSSDLP